jgi:hypothetical protein
LHGSFEFRTALASDVSIFSFYDPSGVVRYAVFCVVPVPNRAGESLMFVSVRMIWQNINTPIVEVRGTARSLARDGINTSNDVTTSEDLT